MQWLPVIVRLVTIRDVRPQGGAKSCTEKCFKYNANIWRQRFWVDQQRLFAANNREADYNRIECRLPRTYLTGFGSKSSDFFVVAFFDVRFGSGFMLSVLVRRCLIAFDIAALTGSHGINRPKEFVRHKNAMRVSLLFRQIFFFLVSSTAKRQIRINPIIDPQLSISLDSRRNVKRYCEIRRRKPYERMEF